MTDFVIIVLVCFLIWVLLRSSFFAGDELNREERMKERYKNLKELIVNDMKLEFHHDARYVEVFETKDDACNAIGSFDMPQYDKIHWYWRMSEGIKKVAGKEIAESQLKYLAENTERNE